MVASGPRHRLGPAPEQRRCVDRVDEPRAIDQPEDGAARRLPMFPWGDNPFVTSTGIRDSKTTEVAVRRIEAGERIAITVHGRVVAELVPPGVTTKGGPSRFDELVASGVIRPPVEVGDPIGGWPVIRLPAGTAATLTDADRGEASHQGGRAAHATGRRRLRLSNVQVSGPSSRVRW